MLARANITVIFLLYSEAEYVPGLVRGILKQKHPKFPNPADWMEVVFVDNGSKDNTLEVMKSELVKAGSPPHIRILHIEKNQGIALALNRAFGEVKTPYVLTTHCDVLYGSEDYIARMLQTMDAHPDAGAIAGQPEIPKPAVGQKSLPFAERVNLVANLQDVIPAKSTPASGLVHVGFVEGRCDIFRLDALKAAGFYDTTLKFAGEDQVMAARMRAAGFKLYQDPTLRYSLSVSNDQNSLMKLVKHQRLFGRAHPYIVLMNQNAVHGVLGKQAGANRQSRTYLRVSQIISAAIYCWIVVAILAQAPILFWIVPLVAMAVMKLFLFARHLRAVRFNGWEMIRFVAFQPALDLSYTVGLAHGIWLLFLSRRTGKPIN